jgi:hypothetical protein
MHTGHAWYDEHGVTHTHTHTYTHSQTYDTALLLGTSKLQSSQHEPLCCVHNLPDPHLFTVYDCTYGS